MGWSKREVSANLVILGDAEGNVKSVGGLLANVSPDPRYPDNRRYELVQKDGTSKSLAGSASINSQLGIGDVGKFVKLSFTGWGHSSNGRFKEISVEVWEDAVTDDMKKWPRWAEFQNGAKVKAPTASADPGPLAPTEAEDDDLPFDLGPAGRFGWPRQAVLQVRGDEATHRVLPPPHDGRRVARKVQELHTTGRARESRQAPCVLPGIRPGALQAA